MEMFLDARNAESWFSKPVIIKLRRSIVAGFKLAELALVSDPSNRHTTFSSGETNSV